VLAALFSAMREKRAVTVTNHSRKSDEPRKNRIIPLRIFVSVQSGRQHLLAYQPDFNCIKAFRVDYLSDVKPEEPSPRFDELRAALDRMQGSMWGVSTGGRKRGTEHIEFTVRVGHGEEYIAQRLFRERRAGRVERIDEEHYRFSADVIDASELAPWIRTFLCRITSLSCSEPSVEARIRSDLSRMYRMYGIEEDAE
jgi:predicted DNA-binding transcriptional regulator YafY